ncbi:MerR family transcriptional regulator [Streptomyces sp. NHF165]|uniref:MerR family transcriptional regulator n=1 Tax=Streptomyces sp. NHF165 TaxID=2175864 RepID=UPI00132F2CF7|nr:MerR family transcriptional regulator [Streptomyces sp. NHF165]QHF94922.1 MerR family transcriptional regulator [Streptomyces sp. NHF165]
MRIGELSRATGVSVRSLRYYDEQGLLEADRSPTGQRVYGRDAPERVRLIQCLYSAGLPSRTVALLLRCESTRHVSADMIDEVRGQRLRIEQRRAQLAEAHAKLDLLLETMVSSAAAPPGTSGP